MSKWAYRKIQGEIKCTRASVAIENQPILPEALNSALNIPKKAQFFCI